MSREVGVEDKLLHQMSGGVKQDILENKTYKDITLGLDGKNVKRSTPMLSLREKDSKKDSKNALNSELVCMRRK